MALSQKNLLNRFNDVEILNILENQILKDDKLILRNLIKNNYQPLKNLIVELKSNLPNLQIELRNILKILKNENKSQSKGYQGTSRSKSPSQVQTNKENINNFNIKSQENSIKNQQLNKNFTSLQQKKKILIPKYLIESNKYKQILKIDQQKSIPKIKLSDLNDQTLQNQGEQNKENILHQNNIQFQNQIEKFQFQCYNQPLNTKQLQSDDKLQNIHISNQQQQNNDQSYSYPQDGKQSESKLLNLNKTMSIKSYQDKENINQNNQQYKTFTNQTNIEQSTLAQSNEDKYKYTEIQKPQFTVQLSNRSQKSIFDFQISDSQKIKINHQKNKSEIYIPNKQLEEDNSKNQIQQQNSNQNNKTQQNNEINKIEKKQDKLEDKFKLQINIDDQEHNLQTVPSPCFNQNFENQLEKQSPKFFIQNKNVHSPEYFFNPMSSKKDINLSNFNDAYNKNIHQFESINRTQESYQSVQLFDQNLINEKQYYNDELFQQSDFIMEQLKIKEIGFNSQEFIDQIFQDNFYSQISLKIFLLKAEGYFLKKKLMKIDLFYWKIPIQAIENLFQSIDTEKSNSITTKQLQEYLQKNIKC